MANTYKWHINALNAKIKQDDKNNVIFSIQYTYTATDNSNPPVYDEDNKKIISQIIVGNLNVEYKEGDPFIEYADLKKSDVVSWLEYEIDVDELKKQLDDAIIKEIKRIELLKNPVDEILYPDWS